MARTALTASQSGGVAPPRAGKTGGIEKTRPTKLVKSKTPEYVTKKIQHETHIEATPVKRKRVKKLPNPMKLVPMPTDPAPVTKIGRTGYPSKLRRLREVQIDPRGCISTALYLRCARHILNKDILPHVSRFNGTTTKPPITLQRATANDVRLVVEDMLARVMDHAILIATHDGHRVTVTGEDFEIAFRAIMGRVDGANEYFDRELAAPRDNN